MSLGIPIKQEPVSEGPPPYEEHAPVYHDFTLFGVEAVEDFSGSFNRTSVTYAPVPGGFDTPRNPRVPQ